MLRRQFEIDPECTCRLVKSVKNIVFFAGIFSTSEKSFERSCQWPFMSYRSFLGEVLLTKVSVFFHLCENVQYACYLIILMFAVGLIYI